MAILLLLSSYKMTDVKQSDTPFALPPPPPPRNMARGTTPRLMYITSRVLIRRRSPF